MARHVPLTKSRSHERGSEPCGRGVCCLEDDAGLSLGVSNLFNSPPPVYPPDFHVGFILDEEADVREVYQRLLTAGVPIRTELSRGGPNIYFMCTGPDGLLVEVRAPAAENASDAPRTGSANAT
jgi:catechol 2,3-dioxygenase-like lactoylglutathione lyase family enzyme